MADSFIASEPRPVPHCLPQTERGQQNCAEQLSSVTQHPPLHPLPAHPLLSLSLCLQTVSSPSTFSPPKSDPLFIFRFYFLPPKPTFAFSPHFGIHHVYHQPTTRKRTAPLTVLSRAIQLPVGSAALQPVMERERTILQRSKKTSRKVNSR